MDREPDQERATRRQDRLGEAPRHHGLHQAVGLPAGFYTFCFTLVTGPRRSLSRKLSDTRVYEPQMRARFGTTAHFCEVVIMGSTKPSAYQQVSSKP